MPNPSTEQNQDQVRPQEDEFSHCVHQFQKKVGAAEPRMIHLDSCADHVNEASINVELHRASLALKRLSTGLKLGYKVTKDQRALRAELIIEEVSELIDALSLRNEVDLGDAVADLLYVVFGTGVTYSLPVRRLFMEVHRSNMTKSKTAADHAGDKGKSKDFSPADIKSVIHQYRVEETLG
jgi:NTP pyrophosphatase (non-canonical NTP hydrolase)